jgi:hypothetical protein
MPLTYGCIFHFTVNQYLNRSHYINTKGASRTNQERQNKINTS